MQPLDDVPFAQLKTEWYEAMRLHVRSVCAKKLSKEEFFKVFIPCWKKAITVWNIQAGFRHTGMWPVDRSAITDAKLGPSLHGNALSSKTNIVVVACLQLIVFPLLVVSGLLKLLNFPFPGLIVNEIYY